MKHIPLALLLVIALITGCTTTHVSDDAAPSRPMGTVRMMTFNIRYDNPNDGPDAWPHRKDKVASMMRFHDADVAGLQEALRGQIDDLDSLLAEYAWLGVGRADGADAGEFSPIFYRRNRFEVLRHGTFWLSETPSVAGSRSWDAAIERIVTWAELLDCHSEQRLLAVNTHFDHRGEEAREQSARLIIERLPELADGELPVVLMGDFNTVETAAPYRILSGELSDAYYVSRQPHHGPTSTWSGFEAVIPDRRIDFIFVNDRVEVIKHAILSDTWEGRFPSDHLPVLAEMILRP